MGALKNIKFISNIIKFNLINFKITQNKIYQNR